MSTAGDALRVLKDAAKTGVLDELCARLGVEVLGAFGSATRQDGEPHDLDIAVRFVGPPEVLQLLDALTVLTEYDGIDLAALDGSDPLIEAEGLCGVPLYECERGRFAERQMAALTIRWDTAWLRKLDLHRLAR